MYIFLYIHLEVQNKIVSLPKHHTMNMYMQHAGKAPSVLSSGIKRRWVVSI